MIHYLQGTLHLSIHLTPTSQFSLTDYSNADWVASPDDRKSVGGNCVFFSSSLVSWSSKKQVVVARSNTKSEYHALSRVACEMIWLHSLLKELQVTLPLLSMTWCDNISVAALAFNPVFHARTKHIEVDAYFIREQVLAKTLENTAHCFCSSTY